MPDDDARLVAGLRRGDRAAFDQTYVRYRPRIFGFLRRLAGRRDLAEDLFQETWIKLAAHALRLAEDTDLAAWLFTVARNQYRSYRRWALLDAERLREIGLLPRPAAADSPYELAALTEAQRRLERALAHLAPANREVLLLVAVEGMAQDQVAAVLGIRHDAVRQRLARARARLEERLSAGGSQ